jgi:superfamily II DNA/RNA helicase
MRSIINKYGQDSTMIFCNRKRDIQVLLSSLERHEFSAVGLHGDMSQYLRNEALEKFKAGEVNIMVASDVAARGIDISGMGLVINFDVPSNSEDYVHRIGRTGRAGCSGRAVMIVNKNSDIDARNLKDIEKLTNQTIKNVSQVYNKEIANHRKAETAKVIGFGENMPVFFNVFA